MNLKTKIVRDGSSVDWLGVGVGLGNTIGQGSKSQKHPKEQTSSKC